MTFNLALCTLLAMTPALPACVTGEKALPAVPSIVEGEISSADLESAKATYPSLVAPCVLAINYAVTGEESFAGADDDGTECRITLAFDSAEQIEQYNSYRKLKGLDPDRLSIRISDGDVTTIKIEKFVSNQR